MGKKERCPQCGTRKIEVQANSKQCKICGYQWTGKVRRTTTRKDKVRF